MDVSSISPTLLIASLIVASTPIMLAAIGELVVERAGVLNLGVEGMMITGAICGFIVAYETGSPIYGVIASILGGAALSLIFAILTQFFLANQVASGLALTLFGLGFSALIGKGYTGITPPDMSSPNLGFLTEIPFLGKMLFEHDYLVYLAFSIIVLVSIFLRYTRQGLILRAVGEDHSSAHALGYKVIRVRVLAILFGGGCAGLGVAYISLIRVPQWAEGMTHGAGWIALAIVVFASWKPLRILFGAWLFGGLTVLQLNLQAAGVSEINLILFKIPLQVQYLTMAPYLITILVLVLMSARALSNAPGSLGKSFHVSG
jgi:simple sugar transport system permease protein